MELKSYIVQNDLYQLIQSEVRDIYIVSDYPNNTFHIVYDGSPDTQVLYPYPNKEDMEHDYGILVDLINKMKS